MGKKSHPNKQTVIHPWALQDGLFFSPSASVDALICQKQQSHLLPCPDTLVPTTVRHAAQGAGLTGE